MGAPSRHEQLEKRLRDAALETIRQVRPQLKYLSGWKVLAQHYPHSVLRNGSFDLHNWILPKAYSSATRTFGLSVTQHSWDEFGGWTSPERTISWSDLHLTMEAEVLEVHHTMAQREERSWSSTATIATLPRIDQLFTVSNSESAIRSLISYVAATVEEREERLATVKGVQQSLKGLIGPLRLQIH